MSRRAKGPRLWLRPARHDSAGNLTHESAWFILDGTSQHGTGCGASELVAAEQALTDYLTEKHSKVVSVGTRDPTQILIDDVLSKYLRDVVAPAKPDEPADATERTIEAFASAIVRRPVRLKRKRRKKGHARPHETAQRIRALKAFFTGKRLSEVTGDTCRAYADQRSTDAQARRELEELRAAINHHRREGLHDRIVSVVLPPKAGPRERWLTRKEAAALILGAWRYRETKSDHEFRGVNTAACNGKTYYYAWRHGPRIYAPFGTPEFAEEYTALIKDRPRERLPRRHIARFMIVARYMGSRAGVICAASIEPRRPEGKPWVDLVHGVFYGRAAGHRETKKRRQVVQVPAPLLAHMRRWRARGQRYVVEWNGEPIARITKGHNAAVEAAGLGPEVTPHTWRHTAATWLMQGGADPWKAANFLAMSVETLLRVYGHHHPDDSADVHDALRNRQRTAKDKSEQKRIRAQSNVAEMAVESLIA